MTLQQKAGPRKDQWLVDGVVEAVVPFLRWPGGKRWLVSHLVRLLEGFAFDHYVEPFLGGAAVFFGLQPSAALLADSNRELIHTYRQVRRAPHVLGELLAAMPVTAASYNRVRRRTNPDPLQRAADFLYLNRTAFAGMYRLNRKGEFNVPYGGGGRTPALLWERGILDTAARALRGTVLVAQDFESSLASAGSGGLAYCDPAFTVAHNSNCFRRYNERVFSWEDQVRLARVAREAGRRGVLVLVSNADHDSVAQLYADALRLRVQRVSRLCPSPDHRVATSECLYVLGPLALRRRIRRRVDALQGITSFGTTIERP
jgi:DNA adenine methylase